MPNTLKPSLCLWLFGLIISAWMMFPNDHAQADVPKSDPINAAYEAAQWANLSITSQSLAMAQARQSASSPKVREAIDGLILARQRYETYESQASAASVSKSEAGRQKYKTLNLLAQAAYQDVTRYSDVLRQEDPDFDGLVSPFPISIAATQALLAPDEALILLHTTAKATYIFCIRHDQYGWFKSDLTSAQLNQIVADLRIGLDPTDNSLRGAPDKSKDQSLARLGKSLSFSRQKAYLLYNKTLGPTAPILKGAKLVYISTSGPLSYLPLSVLVTQKPKGQDNDPRARRETAWLIKSYALATLPAVNSLKFLRTRKANAAPFSSDENDFLGIGAPELSLSERTKDFTPLPGTVLELNDLSSLFANKRLSKNTVNAQAIGHIITGQEATKANLFKRDLSHIRILVFATHAVKANEIEGLNEPALILSANREATTTSEMWGQDDGLLTATQAANLRLNADWVILSACNTASGRTLRSFNQEEMLSGLARGFFAAGAKSLMVSHWRLNDTTASQLTVSAVKYYLGSESQKPLGRAEALRQAMLGMIKDTHSDTASLPENWAAMVVVGEGR